MTDIKKKALVISIVIYQAPRDVLICTGNESASGGAAARGVSKWVCQK